MSLLLCFSILGSCLTGRHSFRYGIFGANSGKMKPEEVTLAEYLRKKGYGTGHFGKWHLGTLTNDIIDANRGGRDSEHYSPSWDNGFDVCFSTESKVPTWNPMITPDSNALDIGNQKALIDNRYKLYQNSKTFELYDLLSDPYEEQDISSKHPETLNEMKGILEGFVRSCQKSTEGADY